MPNSMNYSYKPLFAATDMTITFDMDGSDSVSYGTISLGEPMTVYAGSGGSEFWFGKKREPDTPKIEKVVFNDPATVIIWKDGEKTVVRARNEKYDKEKGFVMAYLKRLLGNDNTFNKEIHRWVE